MIKCINLKKTFNGQLVLNNINLQINPNECVALLGPNGAGKTTLIRCICGLLKPDCGKIEINNTLAKSNCNSTSNIAVLLEGGRDLYWKATVKSNLYYFGALCNISHRDIDGELLKLKNLFNINELLNKIVETLSLGQKQKVSIISALTLNKKVLILDEPTNGLDISAREELVNLLNSLKGKITIIIASHDLAFVSTITSKYIIICEGEIKKLISNDNIDKDAIKSEYLSCVNTYERNVIL